MKTCVKCKTKFVGESILSTLCKKCYFDKIRTKRTKITNKKKSHCEAVKNYQYASCFICRNEYYGDEKINCCNSCKKLVKVISKSPSKAHPEIICEICHDKFISLNNNFTQCGKCECGENFNSENESYSDKSYSDPFIKKIEI